MESRRIVFRETGIVALGVGLCSAVMVGVFALMGLFDLSVLLGAVMGTVLTVLNFFVMAICASLAADKAAAQDVKGGQALISLSYMVRMALMLVALIVCGKSGLFNVIALAIPLVFVRPVLTVAEFFQKKGDNEA